MRFLLIIILSIPALLKAQSTFSPLGARSMAIGSISTIIADGSSLFNNIGGLAHASYGTFVASQERTSLPGANRSCAGMILRKKDLGLGMGAIRFGDATYNEQTLIAGVGHQIHHTSLGLRVNLVEYQAINFPVRTGWSVDLGFFTRLTTHLTMGAYFTNSNRALITTKELLPVRFIAGIGFHPNASYTLALEAAKELNYPVAIRLGFEYSLRSIVFLRSGVQLNPAVVSFGTGFRKKRLQLDAAVRYGSMTGYTAQTTVGWRVTKSRT
ncbi:MAG TPA: hypothetical protein PLX35_16870 [Cyclobacteriaceae bacterium]|nr:hypothetical protein [Cyclobacteriaceae bacterium]